MTETEITEPYGLEVLPEGQGVLIVHEPSGRVLATYSALETALAEVTALNADHVQRATPPAAPGETVTVHRGLKRYRVARVVGDMAEVRAFTEPRTTWVHLDLLRVVEPAATVHVTEINGFLVSQEMVELGHHTVTEALPQRVVLIGNVAILVDVTFPDGRARPREETAGTLYPGDSVKVVDHGVFRWDPLRERPALLERIS